MALYQNEINDLQRKVKDTLSLTSKPHSPTEVYDPVCRLLQEHCNSRCFALSHVNYRSLQCIQYSSFVKLSDGPTCLKCEQEDDNPAHLFTSSGY